MNNPIAIINPAGDFEETVERLAKHLGRDKNRRAVFRLIYGRGSKPQSKKQIAEKLGLTGSAQIVQNALDHLAKHHLIVRIENDGHVKDGSRIVYAKENSVRANRPLIERYANNPSAARQVATKRRPAVEAVSFVKLVDRSRPARDATARAIRPGVSLRIAMLVTDPDRNAPLQTLMEARDVKAAIRMSEHRDKVDLRVFPAPTLNELIDALNEYRPTVIHFSGHGGGGTLLFDNERAGQNGGAVLDFDMIARVIAATSAKPLLLVLVACDTVEGADRFLGEVSAVIAMSASVDDEAAVEFSSRFYRSLSSKATIAQSLEQAKIVLEHKGYRDASLPTLVARNEAAGGIVML